MNKSKICERIEVDVEVPTTLYERAERRAETGSATTAEYLSDFVLLDINWVPD